MQALTVKPLVSIVIPSFNQGRFIKETVDSILGQDYRPIEVLVIDGASTDQTIGILQNYEGLPEVKWSSEPDNGVVDAVNKGLKRARGQIVTIQSSDDLYLPGAIRAAVEFMQINDDVAIVYGDIEHIDESSRLIGKDVLQPFDIKHYLGRFTYIPQPGAFFRAEMIGELGGWREEVSYAADADFWLRIVTTRKAAHIPRLMARYRFHPQQRDTQKSRISRDWEISIRDLLRSDLLDRTSRAFAVMGIYLAKYRYTDESSWVRRTAYLYRAAISNPRAVLNPAFPKRELFPGRRPIWRLLSRMKRLMGLPART
jgi:glycosyltransferase involved in cell wall biosynthesis